jgi:hypothetical protein
MYMLSGGFDVNQDKNVANNGYPQMEDYGNSDGNGDTEEVIAEQFPGSAEEGSGDELGITNYELRGEDRAAGGGNEGQGTGQFGEFGTTGTGIDLTAEMDSDKADVRGGLIKGGQPGEDGLAGLAQYGGEAGDIPPQGTGNIDGNE